MGADEKRYPLSVIIPIHRSDLDIRRCLFSMIDNLCLDLQIIVAANSDRRSELQRINRLIPDYPCINLINIHKAGKANAINEALRYVRNKYVLIGDADTLFISKGINRCLKKLYADETIVAITGIVDPIEENTLTSVQKFEYRRIFRVFRPFWNLFNANLIVSGCAGIFKTEALFQVGLFDCHTIGEDFDITLRLHEYYLRHKIPYKIEYVDTLVAKTDVPKTVSTLIKQRGRWFSGQVDVLWKYRKMLFHPHIYQKIIIPYVLSVLFEVCVTFLKWIPFGISAWICVAFGLSFLTYVQIIGFIGLCFVLFEIVFNICVGKRLKVKKLIFIISMTITLILLQFALKDTNAVSTIKRKKENRWE